MARKIEQLVAKVNTESDERVRQLLAENKRLRGELIKKESGAEIVKAVLSDVYSAPSDLKVRAPRKSSKAQSETAVLHLTDVHFGKLTSTYNTATCADRMYQVCDAVSEIVGLRRKSASVNRIVVLIGGDCLEGGGNIFPGQAHAIDADIVRQCFKDGPELFANVILTLAQQFNKIDVLAVPGNHGRIDKNGSPAFNADSILYEIVRSMVCLAAPKLDITWNLPFDRLPGEQWYAHSVVDGHGVVLIHGDFKAGGTNQLGYPWYSIGRRVGGWVSCLPEFEYLYTGHNHSFAAFDVAGKTVYATGSPESNNDYATKNLATEGVPHQRLQFFNESRGVLADHKLLLD